MKILNTDILTCRTQSSHKAAPFLSQFKRTGRLNGIVDFVASGSRFKVRFYVLSSLSSRSLTHSLSQMIRFGSPNKISNWLSYSPTFELLEPLATLTRRVNLMEPRLLYGRIVNCYRGKWNWVSRVMINLVDSSVVYVFSLTTPFSELSADEMNENRCRSMDKMLPTH